MERLTSVSLASVDLKQTGYDISSDLKSVMIGLRFLAEKIENKEVTLHKNNSTGCAYVRQLDTNCVYSLKNYLARMCHGNHFVGSVAYPPDAYTVAADGVSLIAHDCC